MTVDIKDVLSRLIAHMESELSANPAEPRRAELVAGLEDARQLLTSIADGTGRVDE